MPGHEYAFGVRVWSYGYGFVIGLGSRLRPFDSVTDIDIGKEIHEGRLRGR